MSVGVTYLHSHSGLEKMLNFPKRVVLVDAQYRNMFLDCYVETFSYNKVNYIKVPILTFVKRGGVFKNLIE